MTKKVAVLLNLQDDGIVVEVPGGPTVFLANDKDVGTLRALLDKANVPAATAAASRPNDMFDNLGNFLRKGLNDIANGSDDSGGAGSSGTDDGGAERANGKA